MSGSASEVAYDQLSTLGYTSARPNKAEFIKVFVQAGMAQDDAEHLFEAASWDFYPVLGSDEEAAGFQYGIMAVFNLLARRR